MSATGSKESWNQPLCRGRNAHKDVSDRLEHIGGEPRGFYGAVDGAVSEREPTGRLSSKGVHRIHRCGRKFLMEMNTDFMLKTLDHIKVFRRWNRAGNVSGRNGD